MMAMARRWMRRMASAMSGPAGDKSGDVILASAYGATLGMSLMQSLSNISVINGHATVWGDALPAICRRSGKVPFP